MIKNLFISNDGLKKGELHKLSKGIATGAIIVTLTMIPGCSFSADAITNPNDVVESVSDKTCFDEFLDNHVGTKVNMDLLEDYLDASEDLHRLNLEREVEGLNNTDIYLTYSHIEDGVFYNASGDEISREDFIADISEFIDEYGINVDEIEDYAYVIDNYYYVKGIKSLISEVEELKEFKDDIGPEQDVYYHDIMILNNEEARVNTWLRDDGYGVVSNYGLDLIKTKCCDACGYDESHCYEFTVFPFDEEDGAYVEHVGESGKTTHVKLGTFFGNNDLGMASLTVTNSQINEQNANLNEDDASYNKERNNFLRDALRAFSKAIKARFKQKGSYIKQL